MRPLRVLVAVPPLAVKDLAAEAESLSVGGIGVSVNKLRDVEADVEGSAERDALGAFERVGVRRQKSPIAAASRRTWSRSARTACGPNCKHDALHCVLLRFTALAASALFTTTVIIAAADPDFALSPTSLTNLLLLSEKSAETAPLGRDRTV